MAEQLRRRRRLLGRDRIDIRRLHEDVVACATLVSEGFRLLGEDPENTDKNDTMKMTSENMAKQESRADTARHWVGKAQSGGKAHPGAGECVDRGPPESLCGARHDDGARHQDQALDDEYGNR